MNTTYSNSCRVCLTHVSKKSRSLYENVQSAMISTHITNVTGVEMVQNDNFPDKICMSCFKKLETAIEFKQKCETSYLTLMSTCNIKKEENSKCDALIKEEPTEYLEDSDFLDDAVCCDDERSSESALKKEKVKERKLSIKQSNSVEQGLRPSRATDLHLECHDCGEFFKSKCKLKVHWHKVHLPMALLCPLCKKKFGNFHSLNTHIAKKPKYCTVTSKANIEGYGKYRVLNCTQCPYKTKNISGWKAHYVTHTGEKAFVCSECGKSYTQLGSLLYHKDMKHKEVTSEAPCYVCGKSIKGKARLYAHIMRHKRKSQKCDLCGKILSSQEALKEHKAMHEGRKDFHCELCAFATCTASRLLNHKRSKHYKDNIWFNCDLCEYKCHRNERLKRHRKNHSSTNLPCTVCGRFYESEKDLKKHQRNHFEERKFFCIVCNKAFLTAEYMTKHARQIHKLKFGDPAVQLLREANKLKRAQQQKESIKNENSRSLCTSTSSNS